MKTRKNVGSMLLLIVLSLLLSDCATSKQTSGRQIDEVKVSQIKDGATSLNDIISLFGAPQTTSSIGNKTLYIYKYCVSEGSGIYTAYTSSVNRTESCDELVITFNQDAKVEAHSFQKDPNR
jgi:outer membrane protein assembly factor BamE (lipoprotein component of BamABCDE complex)